MFFLFRRRLKKKRTAAQSFEIPLEKYPSVTTQIAIYNELNVAERVIQSVVDLDYPKDKHFIQVVDDSTDETYDLIARLVERFKAQGLQIEHIHRTDRKGYKAGALAEALEEVKSEFVAIFDADFVPNKDYLLRAMPHFFRGERVGLVQSRWGHLNRNESLITRVQSLGIDGHFAVEQSARDWNDLYMNFNGTAGIMSVQAIQDGGGWSDDTLTEDMDLSYRMQIAGWKTHYLLDVECPAEVPSDINAFKSQQFRWAKGSMQTALKVIPKILHDKEAGLFKKYQALMHTTHYMIHPLMLLTALLAWPVAALNGYTADTKNVFWLYSSLFICFSAPSLIYVTSQKVLFKDWHKNLFCYPALMFIGSGLCISNTKAVLEALTGKVSGFVRTPKKGDKETKHYTVEVPVVPLIEIAAGLYTVFALRYFLLNEQWVASFFIGVYAVGFLFNGILSLVHNGFFAKFLSSLTDPFGVSTLFSLLAIYYLSQSQAGDLQFLISFLITSVFMLLIWHFSPKEFHVGQLTLVIMVAFVARLLMLSFAESDDIYRYIWEGKVLLNGYDPYVLSPDSAAISHLRAGTWEGINHKGWTAIYGPFSLIVFKGIAYFSEDPFFFKIILTFFDFASLYFLVKILNRYQKPLKSIIFYALNPLILVAFSGEGHVDSLLIFLTLAAFYFRDRKYWFLSAFTAGLAVGVKLPMLLLLPFIIRRENIQYLLIYVLAILLPAFSFESSFLEMNQSVIRFGQEMQFNDSIHYLLALIIGHGAAKIVCLSLLVAFVLGYWLTQDNVYRGFLFCLLSFLLLSPTVHPWYLTLAVAVGVIVHSPLIVCWSVSSVFYFGVYERLREGMGFTHSGVDQLLQYLPVLLLLIYLTAKRLRGVSQKTLTAETQSVGVIVPVLNEAENVESIVSDLRGQSIPPNEIIVVDGGSTDNTVELFERFGSEVIVCSTKGRGNQLYAGLEKLTSDIVLVLHADKRLDNGLVEKVAHACTFDKELIGGAVGAHFTSKSYKYRIIEFLNNLRMTISGISFGDQGQFFRREIVLQHDCLKKIPLMEDVELAMHLQHHGKVRKLDGGLKVSVRRWQNKPVWKNSLQIFLLLFKYLFLRRLSKSIDTQKFYEDYYSDAKPVNNT